MNSESIIMNDKKVILSLTPFHFNPGFYNFSIKNKSFITGDVNVTVHF